MKGKVLTLTMVNPHVSEPRQLEIAVRGATPSSAQALVLAAADAHAHNTFDRPRNVQPQAQKVSGPRDGIIVHQLPPASVTRITLNLV